MADARIEEFINRTELGPVSRMEPVLGGANNQAFHVFGEKSDGFLKVYFHDAQDPRDRLGAEFGFSRFAWDKGVRVLPRPVAAQTKEHLGLYEFINGKPLAEGEAGSKEVRAALAFFQEVNQHKTSFEAQHLAAASEACFSLTDHLDLVEKRVGKLEKILPDGKLGAEVEMFVREDLAEGWRQALRRVEEMISRGGLDMTDSIPAADRCISPSDFGFHNALRLGDGSLKFVDFEYAGWDDPAKLVCDFFCQPKVPVPLDFMEEFINVVCVGFSDAERLRRRIDLLFPIYQIKWCCILLNDFLPIGHERRRFANVKLADSKQLAVQLKKAQNALAEIQLKKG